MRLAQSYSHRPTLLLAHRHSVDRTHSSALVQCYQSHSKRNRTFYPRLCAQVLRVRSKHNGLWNHQYHCLPSFPDLGSSHLWTGQQCYSLQCLRFGHYHTGSLNGSSLFYSIFFYPCAKEEQVSSKLCILYNAGLHNRWIGVLLHRLYGFNR